MFDFTSSLIFLTSLLIAIFFLEKYFPSWRKRRTIKINLGRIESVEKLHEALQRELGLPRFYGKNWDAFWDCISDSKMSKLPKELVFLGWEKFANNFPKDSEVLAGIWEDVKKQHPEIKCRVVYEK